VLSFDSPPQHLGFAGESSLLGVCLFGSSFGLGVSTPVFPVLKIPCMLLPCMLLPWSVHSSSSACSVASSL